MPRTEPPSWSSATSDADVESVASLHPEDSYSQAGGYAPTVISEATNRPTLNIYATRNGDIAYEPDEKWTRRFNKRGYKINLNQVQSLEDVEGGSYQRFGQYSLHRGGVLEVNKQGIPMFESGRETRYNLAGFEHGRTYVPNNPYVPPHGEVRSQMGRNWIGEEKPKPDIECTPKKVWCGIGCVALFIFALVVPKPCCA